MSALSDLSVEESECAGLDDLVLHGLGEELDPEVELQRGLHLDALLRHLLLQVEPTLVAVNVCELQTKIPFLPDAGRLENILEQFSAQGHLADCKFFKRNIKLQFCLTFIGN